MRIETSQIDYLEEEKDPATLRCVADSNPPATILWRKEGLDGIFSPDAEINFSPVTRHTAGLYSCTAENALGMSKEAYVQLDVKRELKCSSYEMLRQLIMESNIPFDNLRHSVMSLLPFNRCTIHPRRGSQQSDQCSNEQESCSNL